MEGHYHYSCTRQYNVKHDKAGMVTVTAIFCDGNVLFSAVKYLAQKKINGNVSAAFERQFIQAMRLLLDYSLAHKNFFDNAKEMFESFAYRLQFGTVDKDGSDDSNLRWRQRSTEQSARLIKKITDFSDWLYDESGGASELLNPVREATEAEKALNRAAYNHRMNNSFLKHTYSSEHRKNAIDTSRNVRIRQIATNNIEKKKSFNEDKFLDLLFNGFAIKGARPDALLHEKYRIDYILITMLMHLGGLRESECFHLYIDDIIPNADGRQIRVYHPTQGLAPAYARKKYKNQSLTRQEYLAREFNMKDRWNARDASHAGWKNSVVNHKDKYFQVFLFGYQELQDYFFELFRYYLNVRSQPLPGREHRFLFTDANGDPLKLRTFVSAHNRAVTKIGMVPRHEYGGTPHAHRHSYGQRLADAGVDPLVIKGAMHHASLESQQVYTAPHIAKITEALRAGNERLVDMTQHSLPQFS